MKKFLGIACLALALSVNTVSANAQSGWNAIMQTLAVILNSPAASEAAKEGVRVMMNRMQPSSETRADVKRAVFADSEWIVAISQNGDNYTYYGVDRRTKNSITLPGARVSANSQRQVYTWNNGDYRYQVAWKPSDPKIIRLQVFDGRKELLNRLLYQAN